jgi:hypothetical protein
MVEDLDADGFFEIALSRGEHVSQYSTECLDEPPTTLAPHGNAAETFPAMDSLIVPRRQPFSVNADQHARVGHLNGVARLWRL